MIVINMIIERNKGLESLGFDSPKAIKDKKMRSHMNKLKGSAICAKNNNTRFYYLFPLKLFYPTSSSFYFALN